MPDFLPVPPAELWQATLEHLRLSLIALLCAVALAVPLAVWLANKRRWAEGVLQVTNILQTIPSLALLSLLIPFISIGSPPVLIALTLYALLPIFQNTYLGLSQIDPAIKEAHTAFGLSRWQALWRIELPMALPVKLRVPPNTPNGRTLRVRGKGVRRKDGTMGDLLVTVQVKVPEHLSEAARNALQEYAEKAGQENPRAALFED